MAVRNRANSDHGTAETGSGKVRPKIINDSTTAEVAAGNHGLSDVLRWREIEIMRERAELKRNIMEFWSDDVDLEDLSLAEDEQSLERYYTAATGETELLADFDEDEIPGLDDVDD